MTHFQTSLPQIDSRFLEMFALNFRNRSLTVKSFPPARKGKQLMENTLSTHVIGCQALQSEYSLSPEREVINVVCDTINFAGDSHVPPKVMDIFWFCQSCCTTQVALKLQILHFSYVLLQNQLIGDLELPKVTCCPKKCCSKSENKTEAFR